jgi:hypothetical protein
MGFNHSGHKRGSAYAMAKNNFIAVNAVVKFWRTEQSETIVLKL